MLILAGLGNPGDKYRNNRHNIGFMAADAIARRLPGAELGGGSQAHDLALIALVVARGGEGQGVCNGGQQGLDPRLFGLVEIAQHVGHHQMLLAGMPDAQPGPTEVGAKMADQRADAVLARRASARLHAEAPGRQIDFVMEDDHIGGRNLVKTRRLAHGAAAFVHIGLGLHQQGAHLALRRLDHALGDHRLELRPLGPEAPAARDGVGGHEADVVAVVPVLVARIA